MAYAPIAEHGIIGDLRTAALVTSDGTIDWFCAPRFDAPSIFGSLLDDQKGGSWSIRPVGGGPWRTRQLYLPDTNILITRFMGAAGVLEVSDFMPVADAGFGQALVRHVRCVRGSIDVESVTAPAFEYATQRHRTHLHNEGATFEAAGSVVHLRAPVPLAATERAVRAVFHLAADESAGFALWLGDGSQSRWDERTIRDALAATAAFWRRWIGHSRYQGRWREMVHRSALTLKLLTFKPSGAIVAAPTTSLPEAMGGSRNWDYRYTWVRDAAFAIYALLRLGFTDEAGDFMDWLGHRLTDASTSGDGPLQVVYAVDGSTDLAERELDHLAGYEGSRPVRIGNAAAQQLQLDLYGAMIDSAYLYNKHGRPIFAEHWEALGRVLDWLADNWDRADESIWETRAGRRHFTYSRLMSWVAFERMIRIAHQRGLPGDVSSWRRHRDAIYHQLMTRGWSSEHQRFVQHFDTDVVDASVLLMPMVKFIAPDDPRWLSTLDAVTRDLVTDSLVHRYDVARAPDGLVGVEGTFSLCSFWYVEALSRAGRVEDARLIFEKMLTYANPLGLYAEEIGPTGEQLGNFPQGFTHLALISAAFELDRSLERFPAPYHTTWTAR